MGLRRSQRGATRLSRRRKLGMLSGSRRRVLVLFGRSQRHNFRRHDTIQVAQRIAANRLSTFGLPCTHRVDLVETGRILLCGAVDLRGRKSARRQSKQPRPSAGFVKMRVWVQVASPQEIARVACAAPFVHDWLADWACRKYDSDTPGYSARCAESASVSRAARDLFEQVVQ